MHQQFRARTAGVVLPTTAFILPPLAVFAPLGAAPLLAIAAVVALVLDWERCRGSIGQLKVLAALLAALGLWGALSAAWSILPGHSLFEGLRFLALSTGGLVFFARALAAPETERRRIRIALMVAVTLALILLAIERAGDAPITRLALGIPASQAISLTRFDRGITVAVLTLWAILCAPVLLWRRGALAIAVVVMAFVMLSATALLAALASLAVFAVARFFPRTIAGAMIAGLLALSIAIPLAVPSDQETVALHQSAPWIKWSGIHRLLIWRFAADRADEHPILGWGMDSSRAMPGGKVDFNTILPNLHYPGGAQRLPLHPHDALLQWQLELGVPGLLLGLAIAVWVIWQIGWRAPLSAERRAGALALAVATLAVGLLSFGIWQSWWLSTIWLAGSLYAAGGKEPAPRETPR